MNKFIIIIVISLFSSNYGVAEDTDVNTTENQAGEGRIKTYSITVNPADLIFRNATLKCERILSKRNIAIGLTVRYNWPNIKYEDEYDIKIRGFDIGAYNRFYLFKKGKWGFVETGINILYPKVYIKHNENINFGDYEYYDYEGSMLAFRIGGIIGWKWVINRKIIEFGAGYVFPLNNKLEFKDFVKRYVTISNVPVFGFTPLIGIGYVF
jgi:hypothetical protein